MRRKYEIAEPALPIEIAVAGRVQGSENEVEPAPEQQRDARDAQRAKPSGSAIPVAAAMYGASAIGLPRSPATR